MTLARVTGTVVATQRTDDLRSPRYLLVTPADHHGAAEGVPLIALDTVGANRDELVLVAQGSSARQTCVSDGKAVDAVVVGIVDMVEEASEVTYRK